MFCFDAYYLTMRSVVADIMNLQPNEIHLEGTVSIERMRKLVLLHRFQMEDRNVAGNVVHILCVLCMHTRSLNSLRCRLFTLVARGRKVMIAVGTFREGQHIYGSLCT